ncbi:MAG: hypothetical protein II387_05020 [Oscillospiraceae bacterium]|nr:hypothetical protein [Oscillospiraceae bacterium]
MQKETTLNDPFNEYSELLEEIGATKQEAKDRMWELYEDAITNYTTESILNFFHLNLVANAKKYEDLVLFYNEQFFPFADIYKSETYDHRRTPNLLSTSQSTGSGSADTTRNQTRTTTNTPGVTTTIAHSVNPYDNSGLRSESQDTTSESGSGTITEAYSGQPDHTATSSQASATVSTTGTDRNQYDKVIHGRDGKEPTSEVIKDGLLAAAYHDVLDIIINDIADQIFLQVWL